MEQGSMLCVRMLEIYQCMAAIARFTSCISVNKLSYLLTKPYLLLEILYVA